MLNVLKLKHRLIYQNSAALQGEEEDEDDDSPKKDEL